MAEAWRVQRAPELARTHIELARLDLLDEREDVGRLGALAGKRHAVGQHVRDRRVATLAKAASVRSCAQKRGARRDRSRRQPRAGAQRRDLTCCEARERLEREKYDITYSGAYFKYSPSSGLNDDDRKAVKN